MKKGLHFWCGRYANGSALLPGIRDCTSGADATRTAPLCYQGLHFWCGRYANGSALLPGIRDCTSGADATRTAPLCYQGLHFWCGRYANGSALLPGIGDWINLLITHYSLLITHYYWGLGSSSFSLLDRNWILNSKKLLNYLEKFSY
jgi:hypothetical protein|nr:hypothetical protein [Gloeotrichia echinulata DEX184]